MLFDGCSLDLDISKHGVVFAVFVLLNVAVVVVADVAVVVVANVAVVVVVSIVMLFSCFSFLPFFPTVSNFSINFLSHCDQRQKPSRVFDYCDLETVSLTVYRRRF